MISLIQSIAVGNALRVFLEPPASAVNWRLLRKLADTFTGPDDAEAIKVIDGTDKTVLDANGLYNDTAYYYRPYYWNGSAWTAGVTRSGIPAATYQDATHDVLTFVRDRIDVGLQVELKRGTIKHQNNRVPVLTAPPVYEETRWPVVTVHLQNESPGENGVGQQVLPEFFQSDVGEWNESEGWLAHTQIQIICWSQNPDERIALRKILRRILIANLPVFDQQGMVQVVLSQQDSEDFSYSAPVYQAINTFSCMAPVLVSSFVGVIREVNSTNLE